MYVYSAVPLLPRLPSHREADSVIDQENLSRSNVFSMHLALESHPQSDAAVLAAATVPSGSEAIFGTGGLAVPGVALPGWDGAGSCEYRLVTTLFPAIQQFLPAGSASPPGWPRWIFQARTWSLPPGGGFVKCGFRQRDPLRQTSGSRPAASAKRGSV